MKFFLTNLGLFIVFSIALSSLSGCNDSTAPTTAGGNAAATNTNITSKQPAGDASTYPPLVSGIANADIELTDGTKFKIADRKGKVLLVNLWGIWCGPCRAEMPHLVELQARYRDQGFQVIGLNVGDEDQQLEDLDKIKAFGDNNKPQINYELVRAPRETTNQIYRLANFDAVPMSLLIDRDGHLRAVLRGGGTEAVSQIKESVARTMGDVPENTSRSAPGSQ
ncbi:MAG: TlpA disulfide reductase family protein [Acidobacteriota bacterium]